MMAQAATCLGEEAYKTAVAEGALSSCLQTSYLLPSPLSIYKDSTTPLKKSVAEVFPRHKLHKFASKVSS
jgi:hypothetical protein